MEGLKLSKYNACICEGSAEMAIIDILLDHELLIFQREDLIEETPLLCRNDEISVNLHHISKSITELSAHACFETYSVEYSAQTVDMIQDVTDIDLI